MSTNRISPVASQNSFAVKPLRTAEQVAPLLQVKPGRVYEMARLGILPKGVVIRMGRQIRFDEDSLIEWIRSGGSILD